MAEVQQDTSSQPTPDIGSLVGGDKSAISDLVRAQSARTAEDFSITRKADTQLSSDQARAEQAYKAEGVGHDELKPWDANKEHAKFEHDPIEGFGSVGGVFAMVASAFTKTPMDNAINGMAGALNSIKAGDEAAYERAYGSWKDNTKLALDRHKVQHDLYSDALSLMSANQGAAQAKLHNAAVRFGDSQMLMLAEHGMVKELFELQESRARAATMMEDLNKKITLGVVQSTAIRSIVKTMQEAPADPEGNNLIQVGFGEQLRKTGDPVQDAVQLTAAIQRVYDPGKRQSSAEQEAVAHFVLRHQKDPDFVDKLAELHQKFSSRLSDPKVQAYNEQVLTWQAAHPGETMSDDEQHAILERTGNLGRTGTSGNPSLHPEKVEIDRRTKQYTQENVDKGMDPEKARKEGYDKAAREVGAAGKSPSGNAVMQLDAQYQKAERMEHAMDQMDELMLKHKFITGLGGTLTRPVEAFSNVLGSNATDRKQFQRLGTELKEWGLSVVNDRTGRPLSSEAKDAAVIFAGLNPQDTGANTIRAIAELRPVIKTIKEQIKARGQGKGPVSGGIESTAPAKEEIDDKNAPWRKDPVKP